MKKIMLMIAVACFGYGVVADTGIRVVERQPGTNNVLSVSITKPSLLKSIVNEISATGEMNSFTITFTFLTEDANTYTLATAVADQVGGSETVQYYNYDSDSSTGDTQWLQAGDTLLLTGNDGTPTAYSNVTYRIVLETKN